MGSLPAARARVGAHCGRPGMGLGVAGRRSGAARVLRRCGQVRGWAASGHRRRARRRTFGPGSDLGRGDVRRPRANERPHRHDHNGGRVQGLAHASRHLARGARRPRHGEGGDRRSRPVGGGRARRSVLPPRNQARLRRRQLRRSSERASAAGSPQPPTGTRGAARARPTARPRGAARRCRSADHASGQPCVRAALDRRADASGAGGAGLVGGARRVAGSHRRRRRPGGSARRASRSANPAWTRGARRCPSGTQGIGTRRSREQSRSPSRPERTGRGIGWFRLVEPLGDNRRSIAAGRARVPSPRKIGARGRPRHARTPGGAARVKPSARGRRARPPGGGLDRLPPAVDPPRHRAPGLPRGRSCGSRRPPGGSGTTPYHWRP